MSAMSQEEAAAAYQRIGDELRKLHSSAANHISRRDNNWQWEIAYGCWHVAERIRLQYDVGEYRGGGAHPGSTIPETA